MSNTVQLTCDHGYRLPPGGQAGFRCTASGTWTPAPVRCVLPTCSDPFQGMTGGDTRAIPSIVGVSKTEFAQNEKVQIQCNPEYNFPRTGNTLTCGSSGDWLTPPQRCEAIKCSRTLLSERGYSLENITRDYRVGEKVTAQCKVGFWAPGGAFISICGEKGHFNSVPVECKQVECRRVSPPSHVTISYNRLGRLTVGASMVYGCNGNYEISPGKGHVKRTCEATNTSLAGRWSGPEPVCRLFCRKMSVLSSQSIVYQGAGGETVSGAKFPPNTEAIFSCQKYHQLIGGATRRCQGNGQWTHSQPRCQKLTCRALPQVDNGSTRYSKNLDISSIANHGCNTGYKLNGTSQQWCSATQLWTGKLPTCEKILCPPLSSIKDGSVIFDRSVGSRAIVKCASGYSLTSESTPLCQDDGTWSASIPACNEIVCPELRPLQHGNTTIDNLSRKNGSAASYVCDTGYRLSGSVKQTCLENSTWSGVFPTCIQNKCTHLASGFIHGRTEVTGDYTWGTTAKIYCSVGYRLSGAGNISCTADGSWSPGVPECKQILCPQIRELKNGHMSSDAVLGQGAVSRFSCKSGYRLQGKEAIYCLANGNWSHPPPVCKGMCSYRVLKV